MSKEQQELLDEAYAFYLNDLRIYHYPDTLIASKEESVNKCKTDIEFSEKWGLKIGERELSEIERMEMGKNRGMWKEFQFGNVHEPCNENGIPTRLITVTYNDKTITSYE